MKLVPGTTINRRYTTRNGFSEVFKLHIATLQKITVHYHRYTRIGQLFLTETEDREEFTRQLEGDLGVSEVKFAPN